MTQAMPERLEAGPLSLRRVSPADAAVVAAGVRASWREIGRWMDFAHENYSERDGYDWIARSWTAWGNGSAYEFCIWEGESFVGTIGLNQIRGHAANLGFWIRTDQSGGGRCTLAARCLARAGFTEVGLKRVYLVHRPGNEGSRRVAEKVGFRFEGLIRRGLVQGGEPQDVLQYGLIGAEEVRSD